MSAARFLGLLPALLAAEVVLGAWALLAGLPAGWSQHALASVAVSAAIDGVLTLARALPLLFLLSWPLLRLQNPRGRLLAVGGLWSLLLLIQVALDQYYLVAGTPLGADLFGYSPAEISTTLAGGIGGGRASAHLGWMLPLLVLGLAMWWRARCSPPRSARLGVLLLACGLLAWWPRLATSLPRPDGATARDLSTNKTAYFVGDSLRLWRDRRGASAMNGSPEARINRAPGTAPGAARTFLRAEDTPDVLDPLFERTADGQPPNLVIIIVEGLGRSFSGPDARLGSFTPFLDALAARSLYFDNFLANQGRTFGVLPALFGSLPIADRGFLALGDRMPAHAGLFSVLRRQGYDTRFYAGFDATFDNESAYLQLQAVEAIIDHHHFDVRYRTNPYSSWGYPDRELVSRVLADSGRLRPPFLLAMQTISMHTSYRFPGQEAYRARFERRLDELHVPVVQRNRYREHADIYSSVLYTDDELRRYFEAVASQPWYAHTVFLITGDHRLPEIPMDTHMERYHVPLIVFSPLLKAPQRVGAVSSQLDVTPSLLAYLANGYGLRRPARVTWTGTGLDLSRSFRNVHDIPLKHTKTSPPDFVSGPWLVREGQLYTLGAGFSAMPAQDPAGRAATRLARYLARNEQFLHTLALSPEGGAPRLTAYDARGVRSQDAEADHVPRQSGLGVDAVRTLIDVRGIEVIGTFANGDPVTSSRFVPLAVLSGVDGRELQERYGAPIVLKGGEVRELTLRFDLNLAPGRYFVAVIPSDPDTGRPRGRGSYKIPIDVGAVTP